MSTNIPDTTSVSEPKQPPERKPRNKAVEAKKAKLTPEYLARQQQWHTDRAFLASIGRGREKGFVSLDDYMKKRAYWQDYVDKRADAGQGERSPGLRYVGARGMHTAFAMLKVAAIPGSLIAGLYFLPRAFSPNPSSVLRSRPAKTPKPGSAAEPTPMRPPTVASMAAPGVSIQQVSGITRALPTIFGVLGLMMLFFYILRIYLRRRKHLSDVKRQGAANDAMNALASAMNRQGE